MIWNGDSGFEVGYKGDTYVVDLEKKTCPCRKWELTVTGEYAFSTLFI